VTTKIVAKALGLPTITVRRSLEELAAYDLALRTSEGSGNADLLEARHALPEN
jgi:predicted ArsR family transcriptional regulator